MAHIREGESNPDGDDDKIYLFFSETAVEYDSYTKMDVSRVARVCKVISLGVLCHLSRIEKYYSISCLYYILHLCMSFLSGRLGWAEDAAEEVDFFSKSKARLSRSKQQPASSGPGCFPLVPRWLDHLCVLRCLYPAIVSMRSFCFF